MADISNPYGPVIKDVSTPTTKEGSKKDDGEPASRGRTNVDVSSAPECQDNTTEKEKNPRNWWVTALAILPVLLSAIALVVAYGSRNAAWESAKAAERSADAAGKTAAAAQRNADTAEKALVLSIRPQLAVHQVFTPIFIPGRGVELKLKLANTGRGPAQSPSATILVGTCPREAGGECFDSCPTKTDPQRTIPGSWGNVDADTSTEWILEDYTLTSAKEIESITTGVRLFYVCGIHSYADLFSNPYDSFFCFVYDGSIKRWGSCGIGPRNTEKKEK